MSEIIKKIQKSAKRNPFQIKVKKSVKLRQSARRSKYSRFRQRIQKKNQLTFQQLRNRIRKLHKKHKSKKNQPFIQFSGRASKIQLRATKPSINKIRLTTSRQTSLRPRTTQRTLIGSPSFGTTSNFGRQTKTPKHYEFKQKGRSFYRALYKDYPHRVTKSKRKGVGRWFGPYPNPLGIKMIMELTISDKLRKFLQHPRFTEHYKSFIYENIRVAMITLHEKIIDFAWQQIELYVPRDTGALRDSLLSSITEVSSIQAQSDEISLRLRFFSELGYAGIANNMPNSILKHDRSQGIRGRYGDIKHDPDAVRGFFSVVILNLQNVIKNQFIKEFIQEIRKNIRIGWHIISYNQTKSFFKFKGVHPV